MGRLSEVFRSSTEQLEYKLQIDILEHTVHSVSTVCMSPEAITSLERSVSTSPRDPIIFLGTKTHA